MSQSSPHRLGLPSVLYAALAPLVVLAELVLALRNEAVLLEVLLSP
jgi:hypothetical protein